MRDLAQKLNQHRSEIINSLLWESLLAMAVVAVAAVGFGWLMAGRVLRPLRTITATTRRIVQQVLGLGEREIPSRQVGEMVMQELYKLDKVAYIRFASVYRSFQDAADFRDALKEVEPASTRRKAR